MLNRRKLITGLIAFGCVPAIVKASSLMPVKVMDSFDSKEALGKFIRIMLPKDFIILDRTILTCKQEILEITGISDEEFYLK